MLKLCFVASGVSDHAVKWLNWFAKSGHEVHLISPPYEIPFLEFHPDVKVYGLKRMIPTSYRSSRLWNMPYWVKQARSIMGEIKPDLVEGQYIGIHGAIATLAGYRPLILQAWGSDILLDSKNWPNSVLVKHCLRKADMLFCDSETLKSGMKELGADMGKVRIVYNGVDTKFFSPNIFDPVRFDTSKHHSPKSQPRRQIVISTRSLGSVYQVDTTIRAAKLVLEHCPKARFLIVGDGPDRAGLERLAQELGIQESVVFTGRVDPKQVRDWLNVSQVYVSTSRSDSSSLSLQEAMSCGVACVVSDLPANREWVESGVSGYLTPVEDGQYISVASTIMTLLKDKDKREQFGRLGRMKIVREADLDMNMEKAERYYRELIG